jgi:hypothetical protein
MIELVGFSGGGKPFIVCEQEISEAILPMTATPSRAIASSIKTLSRILFSGANYPLKTSNSWRRISLFGNTWKVWQKMIGDRGMSCALFAYKSAQMMIDMTYSDWFPFFLSQFLLRNSFFFIALFLLLISFTFL